MDAFYFSSLQSISLVACLSLSPNESVLLPLLIYRANPLVSCRLKILKGSGINKSKANQTKLQQGFGSHGGSVVVCAHRELSVSVEVLRIPVWCSLWHTHYNYTDSAQR